MSGKGNQYNKKANKNDNDMEAGLLSTEENDNNLS